MKNTDLILSFNRAFLGAISTDVRGITFNFADSTLHVFVYYNRQPTEEDYEIIDIAVTEVLADFPEILHQNINLKEYHSSFPPPNDKNSWFFRRYEGWE